MNDFSERRTSYKKLWPRFALHLAVFTTARRYASAVLAVSCVRLYPSVRPSQAGIVSKRLDESSWFSAPVHLSHTVLFGYLQKLGYFPPELCAKLISPRQVDDVVNDSRRVVAVYYTSVSCNARTPLLRFVVDLLYSSFLQLTRF